MAQLDYIHVYLFDIFDRNKEASDIIAHLNQIYGPSSEQPGVITIIGSGKNVQETKHRWQLTDVKKVLDEIEKTCKEKMEADMTLARSAIREINIIGVQNGDLPYFVLVMSVSVDKTKLNFDKLFDDVEVLLRPLRIYFEEFKGITRRLSHSKPICPYFVDISILNTNEEMKGILQISSEMLDAEGIPHESVKTDHVMSTSEKLRKMHPLSGMKHGFNLLSMPRIFSNTISFIGHLEQPALNGLMTAFLVTFTSQKIWPDEFDPNAFLTVRASGYDGLMTPWGTEGAVIYLLTMISWLSHKERAVIGIGTEFNNLRDNIRNLIEHDKKLDLEKQLIELDKKGSTLATFISEIGQLIRNSESLIQEFVKGKTSTAIEIPVLPVKGDLWFWSTIKESTGSGAYLQSLAIKIDKSLHKIKNVLDEYLYENEKIHNHLNNLVNLRMQKTTKRQSNAMLCATGAIIALTAVIAWISIGESLTENFTPIITAEGREIILEGGFNPSFNFSEGIKISALSNHHLKFTVTNAKLEYISEQFGKCFFQSTPEVRLWRPISIILESGEELKQLNPELIINYNVQSPFLGNMNNKVNRLGHVVGGVVFDLAITDIQNPQKTYKKDAHSNFVVYLPPEKFDSIANCQTNKPQS